MSEIVVVVLFGVVTDETGEVREGKTDRNGENGADGAT
jgi:hypothetical protein